MALKKFIMLSTVITLFTTNVYAKAINSAEIAALAAIAAIDKNEILISSVASHKALSAPVNEFANMMITQHGNNLSQILEMVTKLDALPFVGSDAERLSLEGKKNLIKLGGIQGHEFEKDYIDAMIKGHQAALELINNHLMKAAHSDEIKDFLTSTRATVENHLQHAKRLQENSKD